MKLTDKTKKRLTLAGLGVLSIVLVVAIAAQFRTVAPKDMKADASAAASDASVPSISAPATTDSSSEVSVPSVSSPDTASQNGGAEDTGDSSGTDQSIQAEVTKPSEPSSEAKTDPNQTPDGKKTTKNRWRNADCGFLLRTVDTEGWR
jgi:cytoskeletal protein RodZ